MDLEKPNYKVPDYMPIVYDKLPQPPSHREAIVNGCVFVHQTLHQVLACVQCTDWWNYCPVRFNQYFTQTDA